MILIKELLILAVLYYWFVAVSAETESIKVRPCKKGRGGDAKSVIHEVSIKPCPLGGNVCELYRGTNATIYIRFTPFVSPTSESGCKVKSKLTWVSKIDMDFGSVSPNACNYMNCPWKANEETIFNATFHVSKMWPTGPYPLRLRVEEKSGLKRVLFCQLFKVKLADPPADNVLT